MGRQVDLVIRGGTILDGRGGEPYVGDVAVDGGRIVAVGAIDAAGREEIEATGSIVCPGFIDVHTHYDGQLIWSERLSPSSAHGVTTVVIGNCGVGFAPCRPQDRERLIKLLEGVEDMPEIVLADGLTWDWESFPDFIAALKRRRHDIDFAVQLPHAPLRVFVMGERATDNAVATEADLARMRSLAREAIEAGALGLGTSRNIFHTTRAGEIIPTAHAPEAELRAIVEGMCEGGGGTVQAVLNVEHPKPDLEMFARVSAETGTPFSFTLVQTAYDKDHWRDLLKIVDAARDEGLPRITAQIFARPIGVLLGLDVSFHPFSAFESFRDLLGLPLAGKVAAMRDPATRAAILAEAERIGGNTEIAFTGASFARKFDAIYPLGASPNYEPDPATSVAAQAAARALSPDAFVYDMLLRQDGHALLLQTSVNYENGSLDDVHEMLTHPGTVPALGDGGAHYGMICDSTYTTFMLTYWARDRAAGRIALPKVIELMTSKPAAMLGLGDRGRIAAGLKADINIIDYERLTLHAPHVINDLPSNGRRLTQAADGYVATIVSGEVIMRDGVPTGSLPGRMVERSSLRQPQAEPAE